MIEKLSKSIVGSFLNILKNKQKTLLAIIIVFSLSLIPYFQTVKFGFTYFDDTELITSKFGFLSNFKNAPLAFLKDAFLIEESLSYKGNVFYRPLQTLSYMVDIQISGGNNVWMYHLSNVVLLGVIACVLFLLIREMGVPLETAGMAGLIYCVHPLFVSSVAWIPARGDLLLVLFCLLSFLFLIEYLRSGRFIYFLFNWVSFTLALFCKEVAVVLPVLFVLYYYSFLSGRCFERKYFLNIVLYIVSIVMWYWLHSVAIGDLTNRGDVGVGPFINNLRMIPESLASFILPLDIELTPSYSLFRTLFGVVVIVVLVVLFFRDRFRGRREKIFCFSWFLFFLLPVMLYKVEYIDYLNHRFFLPLIGILMFILFILPKVWLDRKVVKVLMVVIFVTFSVETFINARSYSDPITFYNAAISQTPNNTLLYNNRGYVKLNLGDFRGAIDDFTKAIELGPNFAISYYNRGNVYEMLSELEMAINDYNKAIELNPYFADAYFNRGNAYRAKGDIEMAIKDYDSAIRLNPYFVDAYNNRGILYNEMGSYEMAIMDFNRAVGLNPDFAYAYNNRGTSYDKRGDFEKAIRDYNKAIELDSNYAIAYYNRGMAYYKMGYIKAAIEDYNKALQINPYLANVYYDRGVAYKAIGMLKEAEQDLKEQRELIKMYQEQRKRR